jgi:WD40 repeat protein
VWRAPLTPADARWQRATSATFAPDSRRALVAAGTRRAVWDTETGSVVSLDGGISDQGEPPSWWPCGQAAGCAPWSPDGKLVTGADSAGRAVVWDARTGRVRRTLGPRMGSAIGAAFSRDGRRVVIVDANKRGAQIWTLDGGRERTAPTEDDVRSAQFVGDSSRVLTVDFSGQARLSDPATILPGDAEPAAVAASADGRRLAVGTTDGELRVFSAGDPTPRVRRAGAKGITSVGYDAAGTAIATVGQDDTARIWSARTLGETTLRSPGGAVTSARFSPDGRFVLVSSGSTTRLWDREMRRIVLELPRTPHARPGFSPDGRNIVLAGDTRLVVDRCYACLPLDALVRHARTLLPAP